MIATLQINEPFKTYMKEHHPKAKLGYAELKEAPTVLDDAKKEPFNFGKHDAFLDFSDEAEIVPVVSY